MRATHLPASPAILRIACTIAVLSVCALPSSAEAPALAASLPDAPQPTLSAAPLAPSSLSAPAAFSLAGPVTPTPASAREQAQAPPAPPAILTTRQLDSACQSGELRGKPCRASWGPILWEALESTAIENTGNIALDTETREDLASRPFWATYFKCVHQFRYRQWRDDDDFMVDYIGHGMQGAEVASSFEQHDPTGRGLVYVNNGNYWRSRLKAMAWITVYEVQWKIGPASEASIGNSGLNTYYTPRVKGRTTNETGFQDLFDTPVVGFWWNVAEDAIDRFLMPHIWRRTHNKLILTALLPLTPCKDAANILRFKPAYYRDFPITPLR